MAKRYKTSRKQRIARQRYLSRKEKYQIYRKTTTDTTLLSFKDWNAPYRENIFLRREYEKYKDLFDERKDVFEARGLNFYDPTILPFRDFKTVYKEKRNDLLLDIKEGKRKSVGNVNREIVSDQAYELSSKQAEVLGEYLLANEIDLLEEQGLVYRYTDENGVERVNLKRKIDLFMKIRQGQFIKKDVGLWDTINDYRASLFKKGMKAEDVRKAVGQTFFNSK